MAGKTILLVEDNPDLVTLTLRALKRAGLQNQVVIARDGAEALEYLFGRGTDPESARPALPYLVLLDLNLPKINGLGVLQHIRSDERTRLLPVVILTSSTREEDMLTSYALGANSYVCKPMNYEDFVGTVQQLGQYWVGLNEVPEKGQH